MDEICYPLVSQQSFGPAQSRGTLLRRPTRDVGDLPALAPHEVRVFRVGERYVEEHGLAGVRDETVVRASSVTVVDCRKRVPVVAELAIPSSGVGVFTLRVTFLCTVRDATVVVRDGVTDAGALLQGYIREIPGLNEEGSDLPTTQAAQVRRKVEARLTAFLEMRPPALSGLEISLSVVEVLSPEELQQLLHEREQAELERERDRFRGELERERREAAQIRTVQDERHRQDLERMRTEYEQLLTAKQQQHDLVLKARQNDFVRGETAQDLGQFGRDPMAAYTAAYHNGALDAGQYADQVRLNQDREVDRNRYDQDRQREDWHYRTEREDRFKEFEYLKTRSEVEAVRAEENRRWELKFIEEQRRLSEEREDQLSEREHNRVWRQQVLQIQDSLLRLAISRGAGDELPVDIGELIRQIGELPASTDPEAPLAVSAAEGPASVSGDSGVIDVEPTVESDDDEDEYGEAGREERRGD
ncbi:MAG: hypothetical protein ACJ786_00790 [Catenulispora sp.]